MALRRSSRFLKNVSEINEIVNNSDSEGEESSDYSDDSDSDNEFDISVNDNEINTVQSEDENIPPPAKQPRVALATVPTANTNQNILNQTNNNTPPLIAPVVNGTAGTPGRTWNSGNNFKPKTFDFDRSNSGLNEKFDIPSDANEFEYVKLFLTEEIVEFMAKQSNLYVEQVQLAHPEFKMFEKYEDATKKDIYLLLAVIINMSQTKKNSMRDYWSTDNLISTPIYREIFSRDRFLQLLAALHFNDNNTQANKDDPLYKIRPIINHFKERIRELFYPFQDICIDESLILWKGRLYFKQYIPSKRKRFGIKLFVACDVETGFIIEFIVYTGANTDLVHNELVGMTGSVVTTMLENYYNRGHILYIDNWYTSPNLAELLLEKNTGVCGTVRKNRKGMPDIKNKLKKGDVHFLSNDDKILATFWCDKRDVTMLSTVHEPKMLETGKRDRKTNLMIQKPASVLEYNAKMGGVDKTDMRISFVDCTRKTLKWYKKVFFHLLDMMLLNAHTLYEVNSGKKVSFSKYRLEVVRQIIQEFHTPRPSPRGGRPSNETPLRINAIHYPSFVPQATKKGDKTQRQCHVCANSVLRPQTRKMTRHYCAECKVGLCAVPCFAQYHTLQNF